MGTLITNYDHGFVYIAKGATYTFNLHSTAKLTDATKSRHSAQNGIGLQVSLEPVSAAVRNGLFGLSTETITLEQRLKITGTKEQTGGESALVEWFYSSTEPKTDQQPRQIHQIRFTVLDRAEEDIIEHGELLRELRLPGGQILIPESVGSSRTPGNLEQVFYRLAFKLIDPSGRMLQDFGLAIDESRRGRIDWSKISALGGQSSQQSSLSYFEANNRIFQKIRDRFFSGEITYTHINDMLHCMDNVIMKREEDFERASSRHDFDQKSHRHVINFWNNNRKQLVNLLHYIDIQAEIRKNEAGIIRDDLTVGITDTTFVNQATAQHYIEDLIARLIIPAFILIIVWYFWSR